MSGEENCSQRGKELFNSRKFGEAALVFEECINSGEIVEWHFNLLGHCYLYLKRSEDAFQIFKRMKELFPQSPRSYAGLAKVYDAQQKFSESERILQEGQIRFPENLDIKRGILWSFYRLSDHQKALQYIQELVSEHGEQRIDRHIGLLHVIGLVYEKAGQLEKSAEVFLKIKTNFPEHPIGYISLANLNSKYGSILDALDELSTAREKFPERLDIFRSYCSVWQAMGEHQKVVEDILSDKWIVSHPILWTVVLSNLEMQLDYQRYAAFLHGLIFNHPKIDLNQFVRSVHSTHDMIPWVKNTCQSQTIHELPLWVFLLASVLSYNEQNWNECLSFLDQFEKHPEYAHKKLLVLPVRVRCLIELGKMEEIDRIMNTIPVEDIPTGILTQWLRVLANRSSQKAFLAVFDVLETRATRGSGIHSGFVKQIEKTRGIDAALEFSKTHMEKVEHLQRYYLFISLLRGKQTFRQALIESRIEFNWPLILEMMNLAKYLGNWDAILQLLEKVKDRKMNREAELITWYNIVVEAKAVENLLKTYIREQVLDYKEMKAYLIKIQKLLTKELSIMDQQPFPFQAFLSLGRNVKMIKDYSWFDNKRLAFIEEKFHRVYINTYIKFEEALFIAREIKNRIRSATPTSMIRLGDGEGNLLGGSDKSKKYHQVDIRKIQHLWWGPEILNPVDLEKLNSELRIAIRGADILGIPAWNRVIRDLAAFRGQARNGGGRGILQVYDPVLEIAERNRDVLQSQIITSAHLNIDFNYWNLYEYIFSEVNSCTVISSHSGLPAILSERYGFKDVKVIRLAGEYAYLKGQYRKNYVAPYPERHGEIMLELEQSSGGLFLVAAGVLGKLYCQRIKEKGGIALDIGAVADYWQGHVTRSHKLNFTTLREVYREEKSAIFRTEWWKKISLSFSRLITPEPGYLVLSVFRLESGQLIYELDSSIRYKRNRAHSDFVTMYYVSRTKGPEMKEYCVVGEKGGKGHHILRRDSIAPDQKIISQFFAYPSNHPDSQIQCVGVNKIDGIGVDSSQVFFPLKDAQYHHAIQIEDNTTYQGRQSTPYISIVMTYYERKEQLEYTLQTISWSGFDPDLLELIIVDDGSSSSHNLSDTISHLDIAIRLIILGPEYKRDKNYCNSVIPYNIGFGEAKGETIIIQNPEVCHIGDVIQYTFDNLSDSTYLVFTCAGMPTEDLNREVRDILNVRDMEASIDRIRSLLPQWSEDTPRGRPFWYNHGRYRAEGFHFLTAIKAKHIHKLGGFLEEFAFGIAFDDNELVYRIRNRLKLNFNFVDHEISPFGIHQWHPRFQYFLPNLEFLLFRNRSLLSRLVATESVPDDPE